MRPKLKNHGFTLIEIIIVIIISAVLAAMLIPYMMTTTNSAKPITMLSDSYKNQSVMENIIADYMEDTTLTLSDLKDKIDAGDYGSYSVIYNDFVEFDDNNKQAPTTDDEILKITIKNENGGRITKLFYEQ